MFGFTKGVPADELRAMFDSAAERFEAGDPAAAHEILERLLTHLPGHPLLLTHLGTTAYQTGDREGARTYLERAVDAQPDLQEAWQNLAHLTFEMGDMDAATAAFGRLCTLTPGDPLAHESLGDVLQSQNRCAEAIAAYEQALVLNPQVADIWAKKGRALLWEGDWGAALDATRRATAYRPGHTGALALQSIALAELGREQDWAKLVDFERLIRGFPLAAPAGYAGMAEFNRALAAFCVDHPTLTFNPADNTTTGGSQTANFREGAVEGPMAELIAAVRDCVDVYTREHPLEAAHPFLGQRPDDWTVVIWGTVLARHGHQRAHIHRDAWLSGVYYAQVPEALRPSEGEQSGWIEFGRSQPYPKAAAETPARRYPPVEGTLYLFPSYFYHRTIPFDADVQRVSIAFDMIPTPRA